VFKGEKGDEIGPGHYDLKKKEKPSGVVRWQSAKHRGKRASTRSSNTIGPGSYDLSQLSAEPVYKYKQSSVFASAVTRQDSQSSVRTQSVKRLVPSSSTRPITAALRTEASQCVLDEVSSEEDGVTPGPGYYLGQENVTNFQQKDKDAKY